MGQSGAGDSLSRSGDHTRSVGQAWKAVAKAQAEVGVQRGQRPQKLPGTAFLEIIWCLRAREEEGLILIFLAASIYGHDMKFPFNEL